MDVRRLILLVSLYVTLDLANPFMPGAFQFDVDSSVEATRRQPPSPVMRLAAPDAPPAALDRASPSARVQQPIGPRPTVGAWLGDLRARHPAPAEPPAPSDDH